MILPERKYSSDGGIRHVGLEFEFARLGPEQAAEVVREVFGGEIRRRNSFVYQVVDTAHGSFGVEMDALMLKEKRYEEYLRVLGVDLDRDSERIEEVLLGLAADIVPCEVVTPPLPMTELNDAELLRKKLHERHARGTRASFAYAFGLHFNVELPDTETGTVLAYLRAFLLLEEWIRHRGIDLTRILSPYIDKFPTSYHKLVLDSTYCPEKMEDIARDYLNENPTRNRALDLLPLFAEVVPDVLRRYPVEHDLIKARPAFHYRLPDCRLDDPGWSVEFEWEPWLEVERLAADPERLQSMSLDWFESRRLSQRVLGESWPNRVERWLGR